MPWWKLRGAKCPEFANPTRRVVLRLGALRDGRQGRGNDVRGRLRFDREPLHGVRGLHPFPVIGEDDLRAVPSFQGGLRHGAHPAFSSSSSSLVLDSFF